MIYPDGARLEPTQDGPLLIRDNIYQIYEACQKITDPDKQHALFTGISTIFPCVIEDKSSNRYSITVSVNIKGLAKEELPKIWIIIHDRKSGEVETYAY